MSCNSPQFPATRWTWIRRLSDRDLHAADRKSVLEELCRAYWFPLYAYARREGLSAADAEDATQSFFETAIERDIFGRADEARGRLRSLLLASMQRLIWQEREKAMAAKRGKGRAVLSFDAMSAEERYRNEPTVNATPEAVFNRQWALEVLSASMKRIRDHYIAINRGEEFDGLRPFLDVDAQDEAREHAAKILGIAPGNLRVKVHRFREQFREALRDEIASTLHEPTEELIDSELRELFIALKADDTNETTVP